MCDFRVEFRWLQADQRVRVEFAFSFSHVTNRLSESCRERAVAGSAPLSSSAAVNADTVSRSSVAATLAESHQRRNAFTPSL